MARTWQMAFGLLLAWSAAAWGQPPAALPSPPASQPDALSESDLAGLAADLGNASFEVRQQATGRLERLAPDQIDRLAPLFKSADSPEARLRIRMIAQELFFAAKQAAGDGQGFLGIEHYQDEQGVHVTGVLTGTAADRAGLLPGDLIVKMDDLRLVGEQAGSLVAAIVNRRPGEKVRLAVERDGQESKRVATLGVRPTEGWAVQFEQLWRERFDPAGELAGSAEDWPFVNQPGPMVIIDDDRLLELHRRLRVEPDPEP